MLRLATSFLGMPVRLAHASGRLADLYLDRESLTVRWLVVSLPGVRDSRYTIIPPSAVRRRKGELLASAQPGEGPVRDGGAASVALGRLVGARIYALDGGLGELADLMLEEHAWAASMLLVAPGERGAGASIEVPVAAVTTVAASGCIHLAAQRRSFLDTGCGGGPASGSGRLAG